MAMIQEKCSVIIPTKNRADDLEKAVRSVLSQDRLPDELIIVDQSENNLARDAISALPISIPMELIYIHDTSISGLVDAKRVGVEKAKYEIICFLEDDIILEDQYIHEVMTGFFSHPEMLACSGVITNQPLSSRVYLFFHDVFFRGIYADPRIRISVETSKDRLIKCNALSGGLSCWKSEVFDAVEFDVDNGFFMFEDIEFSTRVAKHFGDRLYVNRLARLEHKWSPVNRDLHGVRQQRKLAESLLFYKKRKSWPNALSSQLLVMSWWLLEAASQSVIGRTFAPISGYVKGVVSGVRQPLR